MPDYSKFYDARNVITDILQQDLVGPVKDDEIFATKSSDKFNLSNFHKCKIIFLFIK